MQDFGVRFYPIPRACPIPRNVVGLIGGCTGGCPTFVLYLDGREIVVQAPANPPSFPALNDFDKDHPFYDWLVAERDAKVYAHYLEIIVCLPIIGMDYKAERANAANAAFANRFWKDQLGISDLSKS